MRVSLLVISLGLLLACGDDDDGTGPEDCTPSATQVCMEDGLLFDPATLTVTAGANVTWNNGDNETHTATSNPANPVGCPTWAHNVASGGVSPAVQFTTGGISCQYFCSIHATATTGTMRGTVQVQ